MKVKAIKTFLHDKFGKVEAGTKLEIEKKHLSGIRNFVEVYDTKVIEQKPRPTMAVGTPSSALPAAQVSQEQIASKPRRGRKRKAEEVSS